MTQSIQTPLYTRQFVTIWIANFFNVASLGAFFLFPLFIIDRGGSKADIGIMMGIMTLSSVLARPWISPMVDKIGRKKSYFIGTLGNTIIPVIHIVFQGELSSFYIPLVAVRILHGMSIGLCFTAGITYVSDIVPKERLNEGLGMFGVTALVAMAVGPSIAEPIIQNFGFNAYFVTVSILASGALLLQFFIPETFIPPFSKEKQVTFFQVLKRKKVLAIAIVALFFGAGLATQGSFVSPYVAFLGLPNISIFFIAYSTAAVITRILGAKLADRVGEATLLPWSFVINALGYLALIWITNSWQLALAGFITGCGHGMIFPSLNALAVRDEPIEIRGKISGTFTGAMDGGMFAGSFLMGFIGDGFGFTPIFIATAAILLTCAVAFLGVLGKLVNSGSSTAGA